VAVKQIPLLDKDITTEQWQRLMQEAVVMAKASERCRFACRLYGTCFLPGYFCLVMKRYVTSLDKELRKYPGINLGLINLLSSNPLIRLFDYVVNKLKICHFLNKLLNVMRILNVDCQLELFHFHSPLMFLKFRLLDFHGKNNLCIAR
jgi:hypothetical protein